MEVSTVDVEGLDSGLFERRPIWSDDETRYFLKLLEDGQITHHLETNKYRNAGIFQHLENPMRAAGFNRTFSQLRIKWKNLKKTYGEANRTIAAGGSPYAQCPYYDELHMLLKDTKDSSRSSGGTNRGNHATDYQGDNMHIPDDSVIHVINQYAESPHSAYIKQEYIDDAEVIEKTQSSQRTHQSERLERFSASPLAIVHAALDGEVSSQPSSASSNGPSASPSVQEVNKLLKVDQDHLFIAMILSDIKKLSSQKKRRVKLDIQKLLDEALTEEDL